MNECRETRQKADVSVAQAAFALVMRSNCGHGADIALHDDARIMPLIRYFIVRPEGFEPPTY
jgi:hypothetical protein